MTDSPSESPAGPTSAPAPGSGPVRLPAVEEDFDTVLAVVAHPDDLEYGAAAAIARWTSQRRRVVYCLASRGEAGISVSPPERTGPLRVAEQIEAARIVGVDTVEFLDHPDGMIEYGLPLRRDIARAVRRHRPEVVVTGNFADRWMPGGPLNQADHIAVGRAVVDACRDAGNPWVFRELLAEGAQTWGGVRKVLVAGSPAAGHGVDVTDHFATGIRSLRAHAEYLAGLGDHPMADPDEFLESFARQAGQRLGCRYGVLFEQLDL